MKLKKLKLNQVKTMLCYLLIVFIAVSCSKNDFETQKEFTIDPKSTFLRVDASDNSADPLIISLEDNGITPGDLLRIRIIGAYFYGSSEGTRNDAIGVFSSSVQLLGTSELNRIVDAIDAGEDAVTDNTYVGQLTTDIAEDFEIWKESIKIKVPSGAKYLFVGNADCLHADNRETSEGFKVEIAY
jgi:hypothetical protein